MVNAHKYGAKRTLYDGRWYASKGEANYATLLDVRKRAKDIADWWPQVSMPITVNGVKVCKLVIDFKVLHNDQSIEWIEFKGFETAVWRLKKRLFAAMYPKEKLTVVKP